MYYLHSYCPRCQKNFPSCVTHCWCLGEYKGDNKREIKEDRKVYYSESRSDEEYEKADRYFRRGKRYLKEENYDKACKYLRKAYENCRPSDNKYYERKLDEAEELKKEEKEKRKKQLQQEEERKRIESERAEQIRKEERRRIENLRRIQEEESERVSSKPKNKHNS
jgi:hypothetical protein